MARDHSRTPRGSVMAGGQTDEITQLIHQREEARLNKDFELADSLREKLAALGVTIFDKTMTWRHSDGHTGRIPSFEQIKRGEEVRDGPIMPPDLTPEEQHIREMVHAREQARANKNFSESDRIRDELKAMGVEIADKEKIWKSTTGLMGCVIGFKGGVPTELEISTLIQEREKARQDNDYTKADLIRDELKRAGVEIQDKQKTWRCTDGRHGLVPSWEEVKSGLPAGVHVQQFLAQQAQAQMDLRGMIMQEAMRASMNPLLAPQALQFLRALNGQMAPAPPPPIAPPVVAVGRQQGRHFVRQAPNGRTPKGVGIAVAGDAKEAFDFIRQCAASGLPAADADISWLVATRERMRMKKDFAGSDQLRVAMKDINVELLEKEKRWRSSDGRTGMIPAWDSILL